MVPRRAALAVGVIVLVRVLFRMFFVFVTIRHIQVLAIVDAAALLLTAPWVASGAPPPGSIPRRAAGTVALLLVTASVANLVLFWTDNDPAFGVWDVALGGPIGAVALFLVASGVTWGWLRARRPSARNGKLGPATSKERAREDHPNRNVPRPPGSAQLRVRKGPHR